MKRTFALLSALAVLQLAIPAQAAPRPVMIAICGSDAPIQLPTKNHDSDNQNCKICHSAMRGRLAAGNCCTGDDSEEDPGL
jgi:hypothetical protein